MSRGMVKHIDQLIVLKDIPSIARKWREHLVKAIEDQTTSG
ncbi:MAG: hypothetical protein QXT92_04340 [Nitrososphaerota archaeon]